MPSPRRRASQTSTTERELLTSWCFVKLTDSDRAALERVAEAEDRPLAFIARRAIRDHIQNHQGATS